MRLMTMTCVAAGALVVAAFGGIASAQPQKNPPVLVAPSDLPKRIAGAKTPADHEAIAATYKDLARQIDERIKDHESMVGAYKHPGETKYSSIMSSHCGQIIKQLQTEAADYRALAKEHEEMAKKTAKK